MFAIVYLASSHITLGPKCLLILLIGSLFMLICKQRFKENDGSVLKVKVKIVNEVVFAL